MLYYNGVVIDDISIDGAERAQILERINEYYGTSFTGWSDNEISLRYGGTLPNWNAYEKIELPKPFLWKYGLRGGVESVFGKVENNILICYAKSLEDALIADENGLIISDYIVDKDFFDTFIKPNLNNLEITYTTIGYDTSTYNENDNVENWNDYIDIT